MTEYVSAEIFSLVTQRLTEHIAELKERVNELEKNRVK